MPIALVAIFHTMLWLQILYLKLRLQSVYGQKNYLILYGLLNQMIAFDLSSMTCCILYPIQVWYPTNETSANGSAKSYAHSLASLHKWLQKYISKRLNDCQICDLPAIKLRQ